MAKVVVVGDGSLFGLRAMALPPVVILVAESQRHNKKLLAHELRHFEQWARAPLWFWVDYLCELVLNGYDRNKYEVQARVNESVECRYNYIACIKKGRSDTFS